MPEALWIGIDVGGRRKGFHAAALGDDLEVCAVEFAGAEAVGPLVAWIRSARPAVVAVDAPAAWAPAHQRSRPCESAFVRERICGLRFTPSEQAALARTDRYYEWITYGLELWTRLRQLEVPTIECFPTASWQQWAGPRGPRTRAGWTRTVLEDLGHRGLLLRQPASNQDRRDAVAAALTARQSTRQTMLTFGPLTVPLKGSDPLD